MIIHIVVEVAFACTAVGVDIGTAEKMGKKVIIQQHHISYDPEVVVKIYKGEHWVLTQLQRRKKISKGFLSALMTYIQDNDDKAVDL